MDEGNMTHNEFIAYLETLAQLKGVNTVKIKVKVYDMRRCKINPGLCSSVSWLTCGIVCLGGRRLRSQRSTA